MTSPQAPTPKAQREAEKLDAWQPIDTAPNNLLLVTNGSYILIACQNDGRWCTGWECAPLHVRADLEGDDKPTHWMHLPDAPIVRNNIRPEGGEE